jgi:small basic protein
MNGTDIWRFVGMYLVTLLVVALIGVLIGEPLDDTDYLSVLVVAATSTICRAIRETAPPNDQAGMGVER